MSILQHSHDYISIIVIVSSILLYIVVNQCKYEYVFVDTSYGQVKGFIATSREGRTFNQFNSVPFAKPPVGDLRFQPPQALEKWEGTRDATSLPESCIQYDFFWKKVQGSLDCLYLSVYTPKIPSNKEKSKLLPVMVFIHGGHYMFGGLELYGGRYLMDEDVIYVALQYRLGSFGFLNTGDGVISGNMGLKDQVMALKFVRENIDKFGGDPNQVTIFGESAGAGSVSNHMLSESSKGLFSRAIAQSGSSLCPWGFTREPKKQSIRLGTQLNCPTGNSKDLLSCLNSKSITEIAQIHDAQLDVFLDPLDVYGPSIETITEENKNHVFLTASPYKLAAEGKYSNKVPLIIGMNSDEGCFRSAAVISEEKLMERLSSDWKSVCKNAFLLFDKSGPEITSKLWTHHFGAYGDSAQKNISAHNYQELTTLYTDRYFAKCTREAAILHAKTDTPTYMYYFSYKSGVSVAHGLAASKGKHNVLLEIIREYFRLSFYKWMGWHVVDYGVCHADDLQYLFNTLFVFNIGTGSEHFEFSKTVVKLWTSFARDGKPMDVDGVKWNSIHEKPKDKDSIQYLNLGSKIKMIDDPFETRLNFWKKLNLQRNLEPDLEGQYEQL